MWQAERASEDKTLMEEEKGKHRERKREKVISDMRVKRKRKED